MAFAKARTQEQITKRQKEIIDASRYLYLEGGYDKVNFKTISKMTSFTRSTIYTYYKSKDEVLLDVLKIELSKLNDELSQAKNEKKLMERHMCAKYITSMLTQNELLLSLLSILYTFLEKNSCLEKVTEFKIVILTTAEILENILSNYFENTSKNQRILFINAIFCYIMGLYPMAHLSEKQKEAIKNTGIPFEEPNFQFMCEQGIFRLMADLDN